MATMCMTSDTCFLAGSLSVSAARHRHSSDTNMSSDEEIRACVRKYIPQWSEVSDDSLTIAPVTGKHRTIVQSFLSPSRYSPPPSSPNTPASALFDDVLPIPPTPSLCENNAGGLTNRLALCQNLLTGDRVIVRIFGCGTESYFSRADEQNVFQAMARHNIGPMLHGTWSAGRIEGAYVGAFLM
jgi:hypothetical protein